MASKKPKHYIELYDHCQKDVSSGNTEKPHLNGFMTPSDKINLELINSLFWMISAASFAWYLMFHGQPLEVALIVFSIMFAVGVLWGILNVLWKIYDKITKEVNQDARTNKRN